MIAIKWVNYIRDPKCSVSILAACIFIHVGLMGCNYAVVMALYNVTCYIVYIMCHTFTLYM